MAHPSLRRRDRQPRLDQDYEAGNPYADPYLDGPYRDGHRFASPPREPARHKSERHRRPPSPDPYDSPPRRHQSRREPARRMSPDDPYRGRHAPRSPPIMHAPEPPRPDRRKRDTFPREISPDPYAREPRGGHDPRGRGDPRDHREPRGHRDLRGPPPTERRMSPHDNPRQPHRRAHTGDFGEPAPRSRRASPGDPRSHRDRRGPPPPYSPEPGASRRPRSHARADGGAPSPPRGRPPVTRSRGPAKAGAAGAAPGPLPGRSNSMPATSKAAMKRAASLWNNPWVQSGAKTALTAGAQAAMKSRNDPGQWFGPKGAKVATAALGAALVDGFMGSKSSSGSPAGVADARQDMMREGVNEAMNQFDNRARRRR